MLGVLPDARRISEMYVNPDPRTPTERDRERELSYLSASYPSFQHLVQWISELSSMINN
jgi:hypothetical protein